MAAAGAAIASAILESVGLISVNNSVNVIERSKLRRAINKIGSKLNQSIYYNKFTIKSIYNSMAERIKRRYILMIQHISIIMEPNSFNLRYTTPFSGTN